MSIVRTKPWPDLCREAFKDSAYLSLLQFISDSDFANEIHGNVFLSGLLISDAPEFEFGIHMLRITPQGQRRFLFSYTRGPGGSNDDAKKEVPEGEALETLDLFLKVKFGINLKLRKANQA